MSAVMKSCLPLLAVFAAGPAWADPFAYPVPGAAPQPAAQRAAAFEPAPALQFGTSAVVARQLLERNGFKLIDFDTGPSWLGQVVAQTRTNIPRQYRKSVTAARFEGPSGEKLALGFVQLPGGAALARMDVQLTEQVTPDSLRAAVSRHYGQPNCAQGWCALPVSARVPAGSGLVPRLSSDYQARNFVLDVSYQLEPLAQASVKSSAWECQRTRLGVPLIMSPYTLFACS
jgi:hypothetical protein